MNNQNQKDEWSYDEAIKRGDIKRELWGELSQGSIFTQFLQNKEAVEKALDTIAQPPLASQSIKLVSRERYESILQEEKVIKVKILDLFIGNDVFPSHFTNTNNSSDNDNNNNNINKNSNNY